MRVTEAQYRIMERALGLDRAAVSYRNYFLAEHDTPEYAELLQLERGGMVQRFMLTTKRFGIVQLWAVSDRGKSAVRKRFALKCIVVPVTTLDTEC